MHNDSADEPRPYPADTSLDDVLADLASKGYDGHFDIDDDEGTCTCVTCGAPSPPEALRFEDRRRLEGASDPADMSNVLAVVCPHCGQAGALVCRYGPEASAGEALLLQAATGQIDP